MDSLPIGNTKIQRSQLHGLGHFLHSYGRFESTDAGNAASRAFNGSLIRPSAGKIRPVASISNHTGVVRRPRR